VDFNAILLIALVLVFVFCCASMLFMRGKDGEDKEKSSRKTNQLPGDTDSKN
jgi:hypothetical protein